MFLFMVLARRMAFAGDVDYAYAGGLALPSVLRQMAGSLWLRGSVIRNPFTPSRLRRSRHRNGRSRSLNRRARWTEVMNSEVRGQPQRLIASQVLS